MSLRPDSSCGTTPRSLVTESRGSLGLARSFRCARTSPIRTVVQPESRRLLIAKVLQEPSEPDSSRNAFGFDLVEGDSVLVPPTLQSCDDVMAVGTDEGTEV